MPEIERLRVCGSTELIEGSDGGLGVRFDFIDFAGQTVSAFVVRVDGIAKGYVNQCRHIAIELDWQPGQFFDDSGRYLICATHGATYEAGSGLCIAGPCKGRNLLTVDVVEEGGEIWAIP
jgi:nitrite reductase/ring-hydroxylating ferredoxin subunit